MIGLQPKRALSLKVPAADCFRNRQRPLSLGSRNRSFCPEAVTGDGYARWPFLLSIAAIVHQHQHCHSHIEAQESLAGHSIIGGNNGDVLTSGANISQAFLTDTLCSS